MIHFIIEGNISMSDAQAVAGEIARTHGKVARVSLGMVQAVPVPAEPISELIGIAGAVASVISAFIVIFMKVKDVRRSKVWTVKRLKELMEQEMMRRGVVDFSINTVVNFEDLLYRRAGPCVIIVTDVKTCCQYKLVVFSDGKAYGLRVERIEDQD